MHADQEAAGQLQQLQGGLLGDPLQAATAKIDDALGHGVIPGGEALCRLGQDSLAGAHQLDTAPWVELCRQEDGQAAQHHAGQAAGHGKTAVMGLGRHQQRQEVGLLLAASIELPLAIAVEHQVMAVTEQLAGQLDCGHALRTVP